MRCGIHFKLATENIRETPLTMCCSLCYHMSGVSEDMHFSKHSVNIYYVIYSRLCVKHCRAYKNE